MRPNHIYHVFPLGALRETDDGRNSKAYMNRANQRNIRELVGLIPHLQSLRADSSIQAYFSGLIKLNDRDVYDTCHQFMHGIFS